MENLVKALIKVQQELKAPKGQVNQFGGYKFRSCEDILKAAKPLTTKNGLLLTVSDEVVTILERFYVKATARVTDGKDEIVVTAYAREVEAKKGSDPAQITGASSSYARKYALDGLFLIDDTKDADATNDGTNDESTQAAAKPKNDMLTPIRTTIKAYAAAIGTDVNTASKRLAEEVGAPSVAAFTKEQVTKALEVMDLAMIAADNAAQNN